MLACAAGSAACDLASEASEPVEWRYRVVQVYPHDPEAFTQGLVVHEGKLYEGTGREGRSTIRLVDLATGRVERQRPLDARYFGEGVTILGNRIYQLTWQDHIGFVYDLATFDRVGTFEYDGEGWGLTHDGTDLILSDGTAVVRFLDPATFAVKRTITVHDGENSILSVCPAATGGRCVNELEYIDGEIWANIWQTNRIVRFSPRDGQITGWLDLSNLYPVRSPTADVLNGIAYDAEAKRLFVTGKLWPQLYEIVLERP